MTHFGVGNLIRTIDARKTLLGGTIENQIYHQSSMEDFDLKRQEMSLTIILSWAHTRGLVVGTYPLVCTH